MPYKNPEDKRRWELEHREERNARRRAQRVGTPMPELVKSKPAAVPAADQEPKGILVPLAPLIAFAIMIAISLLTRWVGQGRRAAGTSNVKKQRR